jgi:hypothetical protein
LGRDLNLILAAEERNMNSSGFLPGGKNEKQNRQGNSDWKSENILSDGMELMNKIAI